MPRGDRLEELWASPPSAVAPGGAVSLEGLPEPARRYLSHALPSGTTPASAVRLTMTGRIKLKAWSDFVAEEVMEWPRGFVWAAKTRVGGLPVAGYDRYLNAEGEMCWRLLGLLPMMTARGPDVSRSAAGRFAGELCWLPGALLSPDVTWGEPEGDWQPLVVKTAVESVPLRFRIDQSGALGFCQIERWGNPDGRAFGHYPFGVATEEGEFDGISVPRRVVAGWGYDGSDHERAMFEAEVTALRFR